MPTVIDMLDAIRDARSIRSNDALGKLFKVKRQSVDNWYKGGEVSAANLAAVQREYRIALSFARDSGKSDDQFHGEAANLIAVLHGDDLRRAVEMLRQHVTAQFATENPDVAREALDELLGDAAPDAPTPPGEEIELDIENRIFPPVKKSSSQFSDQRTVKD